MWQMLREQMETIKEMLGADADDMNDKDLKQLACKECIAYLRAEQEAQDKRRELVGAARGPPAPPPRLQAQPRKTTFSSQAQPRKRSD